MKQADFLAKWSEAESPRSGLDAVSVVFRAIGEVLRELNNGEALPEIKIVLNQKRRQITFTFVPVPMQPNRRWNFNIGKKRDGLRFLSLAPEIVKVHNIREEQRRKVKEAGARCADPTTPLLVHDEFFSLIELCSNIHSRRVEIARLEEAKNEAVVKLQEACTQKTDIPIDLVRANTRQLLWACCKAYNRDLKMIGV